MLRKSQRSASSCLKSSTNTTVEKKLRFNEENLEKTNHPIHKNYGFMAIPEAKTPFPKYADPVAAEDLRKRLQQTLDRANRMIRHDNNAEDTHSLNMEEQETPLVSFCNGDEERRREEFYKKRKEFNQSEYIIAQQKSLSTEMPEPGPSIGNNWRFFDSDVTLNDVTSEYNSFVSHNRPSLHDITDQVSYFDEQFIS